MFHQKEDCRDDMDVNFNLPVWGKQMALRLRENRDFLHFRLLTHSNILTCGENSLDCSALQGSVQCLEFYRVLGRWTQLCQGVGSCLRV